VKKKLVAPRATSKKKKRARWENSIQSRSPTRQPVILSRLVHGNGRREGVERLPQGEPKECLTDKADWLLRPTLPEEIKTVEILARTRRETRST
jgi:hypothetical protein